MARSLLIGVRTALPIRAGELAELFVQAGDAAPTTVADNKGFPVGGGRYGVSGGSEGPMVEPRTSGH